MAKEDQWVGTGLVMGVGTGTTIGILFNNRAFGAALGSAIGILIGGIISSYQKSKKVDSDG